MKLNIKAKNICKYARNLNCDCPHAGNHNHGDGCNRKCDYDKSEGDGYRCEQVSPARSVSFLDRYREHNNNKTVFGTLWMGYYTCIEFYWQIVKSTIRAIAATSCVGFKGPMNIIRDGYWLVFLSPFALIYWILLAIISAILFIVPILIPMLILVPLCYLMFIPIGIWTVLLELPASLMNKNESEFWRGV